MSRISFHHGCDQQPYRMHTAISENKGHLDLGDNVLHMDANPLSHATLPCFEPFPGWWGLSRSNDYLSIIAHHLLTLDVLSDIHPFTFVLGLNETEGTNSTTSFRLVAVALVLQINSVFNSAAWISSRIRIRVWKWLRDLSHILIPTGLFHKPNSLFSG